jgi:hypothetical protein
MGRGRHFERGAREGWSRVAFRRVALFVQYLRWSSVYRIEGPLPEDSIAAHEAKD